MRVESSLAAHTSLLETSDVYQLLIETPDGWCFIMMYAGKQRQKSKNGADKVKDRKYVLKKTLGLSNLLQGEIISSNIFNHCLKRVIACWPVS